MTPADDRHLSTANFLWHVHANLPLIHPVAGTPPVALFIDPDGSRIGLRGPDASHTPVIPLENVTIRRVALDGNRFVEVAVTDPVIFADAYPLLCAVADRIQLDGNTTPQALSETLRRWGHLLRIESPISREEEIGLLGELVVLGALIGRFGPDHAVAAWRGSIDEEHDFGLELFDVEIKSTSSEKRLHWISSLTQLVPTGPRELWLVSMQFTAGGDGGTDLGAVIESIRNLCSPTARAAFDEGLRHSAWRDRYAGQSGRWRLRTRPATYLVAGEFPRLTPETLMLNSSQIRAVRYQIDLTDVNAATPPSVLIDCLSPANLELP